MSLCDVTFTEARTISGRKVNLIMAKNGGGVNGGGVNTLPHKPVNGEKVQTLVIEEIRDSMDMSAGAKYMEGLQHVITSESPVKKVSDIIIKPKVRDYNPSHLSPHYFTLFP